MALPRRVYFAAPLPMLIESIMGAKDEHRCAAGDSEPLKSCLKPAAVFRDKKQTAGCC